MCQTSMSATWTLLLTAALGEEYWQVEFGCAVNVHGKTAHAHPRNDAKSPLEAFTGFKPIVEYFQSWGLIRFALKHKSK